MTPSFMRSSMLCCVPDSFSSWNAFFSQVTPRSASRSDEGKVAVDSKGADAIHGGQRSTEVMWKQRGVFGCECVMVNPVRSTALDQENHSAISTEKPVQRSKTKQDVIAMVRPSRGAKL